jgi:hypothetical protein
LKEQKKKRSNESEQLVVLMKGDLGFAMMIRNVE